MNEVWFCIWELHLHVWLLLSVQVKCSENAEAVIPISFFVAGSFQQIQVSRSVAAWLCCWVSQRLEDLCQWSWSSWAFSCLGLRQQTSACSVVLSDAPPDSLSCRDLANQQSLSLFLYLFLPLLSPPSAIFLPTLLFGKIILPLHSLLEKRAT